MQLYTTVRHAVVSWCILHVNNVLTKHYIDSCISSSGLITSCKEMTVSVMTLVSVLWLTTYKLTVTVLWQSKTASFCLQVFHFYCTHIDTCSMSYK